MSYYSCGTFSYSNLYSSQVFWFPSGVEHFTYLLQEKYRQYLKTVQKMSYNSCAIFYTAICAALRFSDFLQKSSIVRFTLTLCYFPAVCYSFLFTFLISVRSIYFRLSLIQWYIHSLLTLTYFELFFFFQFPSIFPHKYLPISTFVASICQSSIKSNKKTNKWMRRNTKVEDATRQDSNRVLLVKAENMKPRSKQQ